jgi:hypothetical protein
LDCTIGGAYRYHSNFEWRIGHTLSIVMIN